MPETLREPVRAFYECALAARSKSDATSDPALKAGYLDLESNWLLLAHSHGFVESLKNFTAANAATVEARRRGGGSKPDRILEIAQASKLLDLCHA